MFLMIIAAILVISGGLATAAGMQEQSASYSGDEGRITVYVSGPSDMLNKLESAFEQTHGDVLEFVHMGCGPLRQRVWAEMESGQILADVFWGSDPLIYNSLDDRGALDEYVPQDIDTLQDRFRTDRNYTLVNERYGVIIYNSNNVTGEDVPTAFADLLSPRFSRLIAHADPGQSSTALALVSLLWDMSGQNWDYEKKLLENGMFLSKKNNDVPTKIQEGEYDAGIAPHDAVFRINKKAKKGGYPSPLAISWPEEGSLAIQRPIAISRNEARPEENQQIAEKFVDFMISPTAQKLTAGFGFVSVRKDVPLPQGLPANLKLRLADWELLSEEQDRLRSEFQRLAQ
jgi:iron(III) transport system substrate-binding protein